jgi:uncharacterized membrane protein YkvA (DUF1232 family)
MEALPAILGVILFVLAVWAIVVILVWRSAPSEASAMDVVRLLPDVLRMAARLARDPGTPRSSRLALAGLALWIASPIDLIPEFLPVIGPLDDIVVAAIVLRWVGRRIGVDALRAQWPGTSEGFALVLRLLGRSADSGSATRP